MIEKDIILTDEDLNFGDFDRNVKRPAEQKEHLGNQDDRFRKNVRVTIESWPKTSRDEVIFPKQTVAISSIANFSNDVTTAIRNAVIENAPKRSDYHLGLYDMDEHNVEVKMNSGGGLGNTIWGHYVVPGDSFSYLGNAKIKLEVLCKDPEHELLPNGDPYSELLHYDWNDFADLAAAAQAAVQPDDAFSKAVETISEKSMNGLEKD